ncbi:MAG: hypothetical protein K940chlam2_01275 [Chlamydiae bacterium]|nr:hypothetical protein [Chlamydiota bacterium]
MPLLRVLREKAEEKANLFKLEVREGVGKMKAVATGKVRLVVEEAASGVRTTVLGLAKDAFRRKSDAAPKIAPGSGPLSESKVEVLEVPLQPPESGVRDAKTPKGTLPLTEEDMRQARARMDTPPPTDKDIKREADLFATHMAHMVGMRMLDTYFGIEKPEAFYIELGGSRDAYFKHLDRSDLFFLSRWIAKLAYRIFEWVGQGAIEGATLSLFEALGKRIESFEQGEFNEMMEWGGRRTNAILRKWTELIKGVTTDAKKSERVVELIDQKINVPNAAFYREISTRLIDEHFDGISIGRVCYNLLMSMGVSEGPCLSCLNFMVRALLYPLALALRIVLGIPDYFLSNYIISGVKKKLIDDQMLENLVQELTEGVAENKALVIPVCTAMNEALEEVLLDLIENPDDHEADGLREFLSPVYKELIRESVVLSGEAVGLFSCETVGELEAFIEKGPGVKGRVQNKIKEEKAKGIEDIVLLAHRRLTDSQYLRTKLFGLIQGLNGAFSASKQTEQEQQAELEKVQGRLFTLVNAVIAKAIQNAVSARFKRAGLPAEGLIFGRVTKGISDKVFKVAFAEVEKMTDMGKSPVFLKFAVQEALGQFFHTEPA